MIEYMTLENICTRIVDCPHETPEWKSEGIAVIRNFNLVDGRIDMQDGYYVDEETFKKRTKRAVPSEGDIIFSREAPIGNCAIVPKGFKCCLGQRLVLLKVNNNICSSEYLLSVLQSSYVRQQIDQVSKRGSIVSNFAIGDLHELVIPVLNNQEDVAQLSSTISEKISNNNAICSELDSMLKLIYDYWFVQFDFPDENGKPYKSSGGKMVWNEELKREIPEGWKSGQVSNLGDVIGGATPSTKNVNFYVKDGIGWITPYDLSKTTCKYIAHGERDITAEAVASCSTTIMPRGTVLMSSRAPIGYLAIASDSLCTNQGFKSIVPKGYSSEFVYQTLSVMMPYIKGFGVGSTFAEVSKEDFSNMKVVLPSKRIEQLYTKKTKSIESLRELLEKENQQLASLRDFLLPMLMNGQVTFKDN